MDAVKLLTIDCWREVLKRVKNPEDLKNCSETCLLFQALLWKKRNSFLFDLCLPKIFEYLRDVIQIPVEDDDGNFFEARATWKPVYDCRAVCKDWCKSVDRFAETTTLQGRLFDYQFYDGDITERFLNMFAQHVGNPFVGRKVAIVCNNLLMASPQNIDQNEGVPQDEIFHIEKIRQLLSRFGKEIWTLEIFERFQTQHLALCKNILTVLSQLPNLRELIVYDMMSRAEQGNIDELPAYIAANPLPPLPNLERVYIPGLNPVMVGSILKKYSPQLKYLMSNWDPSRFPEELPRFNCLEELNLQWLDASVSLQGFRQLHSPLERLSLEIAYNSGNVTVWPIDELFRNIQHLPIGNLELKLQAPVFLGESAPTPPELRARNESIRAISVSCSSCSVSLNFLSYCPNLEVFDFTHRRPLDPELFSGHPDRVAELLDVTGLIKENRPDMYQSNIWEMVPSLQSFHFNEFDAVMWRWIRLAYFRKTYEENKKI